MKELCIRCGKETEYDINTPIYLRHYFIEGSGQLCEDNIEKDELCEDIKSFINRLNKHLS